MRPKGTPAELERRRQRAVRLLEGGHSLATVARMVGAAVSAVWQWRETFRRRGVAGLAARPAPGRPPKLTARQRQRLPRLLRRGARTYGYATDLWTTKRVAAVIAREFAVAYHPAHVSRLLAVCGWSCQKPERRAVERDEAAIAHWKRYRWTAIKKKARRLNAYLVFLDESGFLLLPTVRRTWAPRGETSLLRHRYRRDKVSAISAVTVSPRRHRCGLYAYFHCDNITQVEVALFLRLLLRHWPASSSCSGTGARFMGDQRSRSCWAAIPASSSNAFRRTRRNSTPTSWCGTTSKASWPTEVPTR